MAPNRTAAIGVVAGVGDGPEDRPGPPLAAIIGAAAAAVVLIVGVVVVVARDDGESTVADGVEVVEIPITDAAQIAVGAGAVWVVRDDEDAEDAETVARIDPASGKVTDEVEVESPRALAADDDAVWVGHGGELVRLDPASLETVAEVRLPDTLADDGVAVGGGGVWVLQLNEHMVRIDPATNEVEADIPVDGDFPTFAVGDDAVWVSPGGIRGSELRRIDADSHEVTTIDLARDLDLSAGEGAALGPVTVGDGRAWVGRVRYSTEDLTFDVDLCRVDADAEDYECAASPVRPLLGEDLESLAFGEAALWAMVQTNRARDDRNRIVRIDPDSLDTTASFELPIGRLFDLAVGEGAAWATQLSEGAGLAFKVPA